MQESTITKIALRATRKNAHKKNVTIQDDENGLCRYVSTHQSIFRVMICDYDNKPYAETVPFIGF